MSVWRLLSCRGMKTAMKIVSRVFCIALGIATAFMLILHYQDSQQLPVTNAIKALSSNFLINIERNKKVLFSSRLLPSSNITAFASITTTTTTTTTTTNSKTKMATSHNSTTTVTTSAARTDSLTPSVACPFPKIDPFDPSIKRYLKTYDYLKCTGMPSLVYLDGDRLKIDKTKVEHVDFCGYSPLTLSNQNDVAIENLRWSHKFKDSIKLRDDDEHIFSQCRFNGSVVGESYIARIIDKPLVEKRSEKLYKTHLKNNKPAETMSVLFVGIDGMSKQNLMRTMPKTRDFIINNMNAKEMNKFNKVGDNTYPNIIPLHTGFHKDDLKRFDNFDSDIDHFDKIENTFLWHEFQKSGYRTAMMFDVIHTTAFHYLKNGWKKPTFDYYNRPLPIFMTEHADPNEDDNCYGDRPFVSILLDYWLRLTTKFNNTKTKPYFAYTFFTRLSHDDHNEASKGDQLYLEFFKEIHSRNVLNNTLLLFFSDHGLRFGGLLDTFHGKVETRSPFFFFMFPLWFEKKYPKEMANFYVNQNRLATNFDVHATLLDLLNFRGKTNERSTHASGISLFKEIQDNRTCEDAKVPKEYCLCSDMSTDEVTKDVSDNLSKQFLDMINDKTKLHRKMCAFLQLKNVISIFKLNNEKKTTQSNAYYQITVEATPGGGSFEGLLNYDVALGTASLVGNIIRVNLYRGQDACVESHDLKMYCYCL